ncbi:uncharacterized protein LOC133708099 [Rosa rugosa]|uniref:uncharacterized protein LOC133708099 n=1 Tax=Rosa rugosa TaxID=74645 RepID=UPI002B416253|nr:uncharacterized protein LOC133708099 [Rosa rugosa]
MLMALFFIPFLIFYILKSEVIPSNVLNLLKRKSRIVRGSIFSGVFGWEQTKKGSRINIREPLLLEKQVQCWLEFKVHLTRSQHQVDLGKNFSIFYLQDFSMCMHP